MRYIPAELRRRINEIQQTPANNANPEMHVVLAKANRYIQESSLKPITIHDGRILGPYDLAPRKEEVNDTASELVRIYIEQGEAHVATSDVIQQVNEDDIEWEYQYTIGEAVDVAIEFDCYWEELLGGNMLFLGGSSRFSQITFGEPYLFRVLPNGDLRHQRGENGSGNTLARDVTSVAACRGWKNANDRFSHHDHGLIIAYTKTDGRAYYRNYAEQSNGERIWEEERLLPDVGEDINHISVFRTNDFRTGFLVSNGNRVEWVISERNWANMAIPSEYLAPEPVLTVDFIPIHYPERFHFLRNRIDTKPEIKAFDFLYALPDYEFFEAYNEDGFAVYVTTNHRFNVETISPNEFTLTDENGREFSVLNVVTDYPPDYHGQAPKAAKLETENFNNAVGDIVVSFVNAGTTNGEAEQTINPMSITFTPVNLEPEEVSLPEPTKIYNAELVNYDESNE
jgi:hypothetical protein